MDKDSSHVLLFDNHYCNDRIRQLKIMHCCLPSDRQALFACLIRLLEIRSICNGEITREGTGTGITSVETETNPIQLIDELIPLCETTDRPKLQQLEELLQTMDMIKSIQALFPEGCGQDMSMEQILSAFGSGMPDLSAFSHINKEDNNESGKTETGMDA